MDRMVCEGLVAFSTVKVDLLTILAHVIKDLKHLMKNAVFFVDRSRFQSREPTVIR